MAALIGLSSGSTLWAVRSMLRRQSAEIAAKLDELDDVRDDLAKHKLSVAETYIRREDAVIFFSRFEQKIDSIWNFLHERERRGS
ncbi:MAG: hypothetical protein QJR02_08220 [Sinobacteraceae bacterium]|nr:hypothetical protein [Nevskiaceae bacterium]